MKEIKPILNEMHDDNRIKDAINRVLRVRITYNDKKPHVISNRKGYKTRYILPVAYGKTKSGKNAVRAFQTTGSTKRGVPKWKLFLVDNIVSWDNGKTSFKKYKDELIRLGLNTNGDKGMTTLYAITPFANSNVQVSKFDNDITPEPIVKTDVTPTTNTQTQQNLKKSVPRTVKDDNFNIDNAPKLDYNPNIESPSTVPITKTDIEQQNNIPTDTQNDVQPDMEDNVIDNEPKTEPITKSDIEGEVDDEAINEFVNKYKDLTNRMNNL